ncbi:hypothetical protein WLH_02273 [Escherichia coli O25b:H4]|uniref:Uncharacterized protein n=1 Tax=Escherichia coli O25b:H4 TaxID=941280 RepID=A0A192CDB5_ECO25|nr:hypothetical protein WLH_02273 [Escherichia coli O25b:H4]
MINAVYFAKHYHSLLWRNIRSYFRVDSRTVNYIFTVAKNIKPHF